MTRKPQNMLCALLALALMLSAISGVATTVEADPPPPGPSFTDIRGHWAREAIGFMVGGGFMQGTSDTTFAPNMALSRGMTATILYRMAEEPPVQFATVFSDVAPGRWYSDAVVWAHENHVVEGVGDGRFAPDTNITRQEIATILYRLAEAQGHDVAVTSSTISNFPDVDLVSEWAETAMDWAVYSGIMRGTDLGELNPRGNATRAEAATVLMRFVEHFTDSDELEPLCPELETRIRQDFQIAFNVYDLDTVWIEPYLGTYNGSVALYFGPGILDVAWREEVAGLIFSYRSNERIWVWNDGAFYTLSGTGRGGSGSILPSAYELGLLTAEDIRHIHFRFGLMMNDN